MLAVTLTLAAAPFSPPRVSYSALRNDARTVLTDALSSTGIIQVTGIPGLAAGRKAVLAHALECANFDQTHTFPDGTTRRTMAARTIAGPGGAQPFSVGTSDACTRFEAAAAPFRTAVDTATRLFAQRVSSLLDLKEPLLVARDDPFSFDDFFSVADNGVHLEHVHAYTPPAASASAASTSPKALDGRTLEMHTDQGLFIAFTPALIPATGAAAGHDDPSVFYVSLPNGTVATAAFEPDALVFMVGAGLEQLVSSTSGHTATFVPRATPHALTVTASSAAEATTRMWYGRMVLPPAGATVPGTKSTYGEVREAMDTDALNEETPSASSPLVSLGCGGEVPNAKADAPLRALHSRLLSEPASCNNGAGLLCWHRCMALSAGDQLGSSAVDCAASNLLTQCVNSRDQLSSGGHGDYFPSCTNTTAPETPYPPLPTSPRAASCAAESAFLAHAEAAFSSGTYHSMVNLTAMCGGSGWGPTAIPGTPCIRGVLMWSVDGATVHAKMITNALFGWLSVGLANPGGGHNGMDGGHIVMGLPATPTTYSPVTGLVLTDATPSVDEYIINESGGSAFRLWQTPYATPAITGASTEATDCYTSMTFSTASIAGQALNVSGTDELIWGLNDMDSFVGYHRRNNRGKITIDWTGGTSDAIATEILIGGVAGAFVAFLLTLFLFIGCILRANRKPAGDKSSRTSDDVKAVDTPQVDVQMNRA